MFDASTLIGATIYADSVPRMAVDHARDNDTFALSKSVYDEIFAVLYRPRLVRFVRPELRAELVHVLTSRAVWFVPTVRVDDCRDGKDNKYLELALAAGASGIVSSDEDLLVLHPWRGIRILRPAAYLAVETA